MVSLHQCGLLLLNNQPSCTCQISARRDKRNQAANQCIKGKTWPCITSCALGQNWQVCWYLWQHSCCDEVLVCSWDSQSVKALFVASTRHTVLRLVKPDVLTQLQGWNTDCAEATQQSCIASHSWWLCCIGKEVHQFYFGRKWVWWSEKLPKLQGSFLITQLFLQRVPLTVKEKGVLFELVVNCDQTRQCPSKPVDPRWWIS